MTKYMLLVSVCAVRDSMPIPVSSHVLTFGTAQERDAAIRAIERDHNYSHNCNGSRAHCTPIDATVPGAVGARYQARAPA